MIGSSSRHIAGAALLAAALAVLSPAPAAAGTVTFTLDPAALQSFLGAVMPYEVVVGKHGLSETLTLSNPREVRFVNGGVHLKLDYRGTPMPVEDVMEVTLAIQWSEVKKAFEARVSSLPIRIPAFGAIELAEYLRPFTIPSIFSQVAGEGDQMMGIDGKILSLKVLDTMIQASVDVTFRKTQPAPTAAQPSRPAAGR